MNKIKLVLEVDGFSFHNSEDSIEHDNIRNKFMNDKLQTHWIT